MQRIYLFFIIISVGVAAPRCEEPSDCENDPVETPDFEEVYAQPRNYRREDDYHSNHLPYQFAYELKAEDHEAPDYSRGESPAQFGHIEAREKDNTKGKYYVLMPDGRLKTVEYYVEGDSGFHARVSYDGKAAPS